MLNRFKSVAAADCRNFQMEARESRVAAVINKIFNSFLGSADGRQYRALMALTKVSAESALSFSNM